MSDYHLHLHPHRPMPGAPPMGVYPPGHIERYVEAALARGVTELGFTEHLYRCVEAEGALGRWWQDEPDVLLREQMVEMVERERCLSLDRYVEVVLAAKSRGLPVKLGLEVDFQPGREQAVLDLIAPYPWDFLIGSVHWIGGWDFTSTHSITEFKRRGAATAWQQYFELETQLAGAGMVDVLAHPDFIKRVGLRPDARLMDSLYQPLVAAAAASGIAVEVSSAGLRKAGREIYPAPRLLSAMHDAGVPITLASDGHVAEDAGLDHALVVAAARAAGYAEYLRFDRRAAIPTDLPPPGEGP